MGKDIKKILIPNQVPPATSFKVDQIVINPIDGKAFIKKTDNTVIELGSGSGTVVSGTTNTGSLLTTASATNNVITFTQGDGSTFNLTVDTGSAGGADNLGNHIATQDLDMAGNSISASLNITASGDISASGDIIANNITSSEALLGDLRIVGDKIQPSITDLTHLEIDASDARIQFNIGGSQFFKIDKGSPNSEFILGTTLGTSSFDFFTKGFSNVTPALKITSSGNVGIGTKNPDEKLEVIGNISASGDIIGANISGSGLFISGTGGITIAGNKETSGSIKFFDNDTSASIELTIKDSIHSDLVSAGNSELSGIFAGRGTGGGQHGYLGWSNATGGSQQYFLGGRDGGNLQAHGTTGLEIKQGFSRFLNVPLRIEPHVTASGNISASGVFIGLSGSFTHLTNVNTTNVTASGFISSSNYSETSTQSQFSIGNTIITINDDDDTGANGIFRIAPGGVNSNSDIEVFRHNTVDNVTLSVGSQLHLKRNGGATPTLESDLGGFIVVQDYNGDSVTQANPFNNGAGFGIRNTNSGTPVICSLLIHGVFGAGNSAGSTLHIGNPTGFASSTGTEEYNLGQNVHFKNNTLLEIAYGPASASNDRDIIRYQGQNTDSITDNRHGLQLSAVPNAGASSVDGKGQATNGSPTIDMDALGLDVRGFVKPGQTIYVHEGHTDSIDTSAANFTKFTVQSVDSVNETITLDSNWNGASGNVSCWIEDTLVVIRNFNGDEKFRFHHDGTLDLSGSISASGDITASGGVNIEGTLSIPGFTDVSASIATLTLGADNLGNHIATQDLDMAGNSISASLNITASGNISASGDIIATNVSASELRISNPSHTGNLRFFQDSNNSYRLTSNIGTIFDFGDTNVITTSQRIDGTRGMQIKTLLDSDPIRFRDFDDNNIILVDHSGSLTLGNASGHEPHVIINTDVTASGNISASNTVFANRVEIGQPDSRTGTTRLVINKNSSARAIIEFPASSSTENDPGFIRHTELSTDNGRMEFCVSDQNGTNDTFAFGHSGGGGANPDGNLNAAVTFTARGLVRTSGSIQAGSLGNTADANITSTGFISSNTNITASNNIKAGGNISASGDIFANNIRAVGDVIAQRYIVSSSVSHITQSFSSGSTIFGDTSNDTHQFTGSLLLTGSSVTSERTPLVITADGEVQVANADFITSGDVGAYELDISSSGDNDNITITNNEVLIISGAGGLDVTADTNTLTFTVGNGILSGSAQIATDISGAIDAATSSFLLNTTDTFEGLLTLSGSLNTTGNGHITASGNISASGTITGNSIVGTLATAAQTNITSVGTLGSLTLGGDIDMGGNTLNMNAGEIHNAATVRSLVFEATADQDLTIQADGNITFKIDDDNDETGQSFKFQNNNTEIANLDESGNFTLNGNISASGDITCSNITVAGDITSVGDDVTIGDNLVFSSVAGQIQFHGDSSGGGNEGVLYKDSAGGNRFGLIFPGSDVVALVNRASDGTVEIRANSSTAGSSGEVIVAEFKDDLATFNTTVNVAGDIVHDGDTDTKIAFSTNDVKIQAGNTSVFESSPTGSVLPNVHQNVFDTGSLALNNNSAMGDIVKFGDSSTVAGGIYYLNSQGGWSLAQANASGTATSSLAVAVGTNSTTHGMCLRGFVNPFTDPGAGIGNPVYLSDTAQGRFIATAPNSTGDIVRILGHQFGTDLIYFNPSNDFIVHA